jgi:hypothetical protein
MIDTVSRMLKRCNTEGTNICPTILYNEGWMTRLLVEVSLSAKLKLSHIDFGSIRHWYSEGLLSSPFLARSQRDKLAEGYTHADMALGDFHVDASNRGDISITGTTGIFGVIEAKMGSQLSHSTKNAPSYDQASRNLACIAFNTLSTNHNIFFAVAAPQQKIEKYKFEEQVNISKMIEKIEKRFDMYKENDKENDKVYALKEQVLQRARTCRCFVVSYETWIEALSEYDIHPYFNEFLNQCYRFNKIRHS